MAYRARSSERRSAADEMMSKLTEDFDYEASRLMDDVNEFTSDVTKRIVVMRNIQDQLEDLSRDARMRIPRKMDGIEESGMEVIGLAFRGRYMRIGNWPGDLDEPSHWMENKRYKPRADEDWKESSRKEEYKGWHGGMRNPKEQEEYERGLGRSAQADKAKFDQKRDRSRGRPQTRGGDRIVTKTRDPSPSTTKSPYYTVERGMDVNAGEVNMIDIAQGGLPPASSSGETGGLVIPPTSSAQRGVNKMRPTTSEKLSMSLDEVAATEQEDSVAADAQRDMRIQDAARN